MVRTRSLIVVAALLVGTCGAHARCAANVDGLRQLTAQPSLALRWIETDMEDAKPLVLQIADRAGALHLRFDKTREGLWGEGNASVCEHSGSLTLRFEAGHLKPGPAANWLVRSAMQRGMTLKLALPHARALQVATTGWSGRFEPKPESTQGTEP